MMYSCCCPCHPWPHCIGMADRPKGADRRSARCRPTYGVTESPQAGRQEPRPDVASAENNMLNTYLNKHMHEKMRADAEPIQCLGEQAPDPSFRSLARERERQSLRRIQNSPAPLEAAGQVRRWFPSRFEPPRASLAEVVPGRKPPKTDAPRQPPTDTPSTRLLWSFNLPIR
jgi:hypothetical protein